MFNKAMISNWILMLSGIKCNALKSLPSRQAPTDQSSLSSILKSDFAKSGTRVETMRSLILNNIERFKAKNATESVIIVDLPTDDDDTNFIKGLADISRGDLYTVAATLAQEHLIELEKQAQNNLDVIGLGAVREAMPVALRVQLDEETRNMLQAQLSIVTATLRLVEQAKTARELKMQMQNEHESSAELDTDLADEEAADNDENALAEVGSDKMHEAASGEQVEDTEDT